MNKTRVILFLVLVFPNIIMAQEEVMVHITAPDGYRVYFDNQFKGVTEASKDGLSFYTVPKTASLRISRQNEDILDEIISINNKPYEFDLFSYIDNTPVDYWEKLFEIMGKEGDSSSDAMTKSIEFIMAERNSDASAFLHELRKKNIGPPLVIEDGFYYGLISEGETFRGEMANAFYLVFMESDDSGDIGAVLRLDSGPSGSNNIYSMTKTKFGNGSRDFTSKRDYTYFYCAEDKNIDFYPDLGYLRVFFPAAYGNVSATLTLFFQNNENKFVFNANNQTHSGKFRYMDW